MLLPTTLCLAAAAAIVNIWLANRIGQLRHKLHVSIGDGGDDLLARRMRAQLNFAENVPVVLVLVAAIEFSQKGGLWLAIVAAIFMLARLLHAFGMDGGKAGWARAAGIVGTFVIQAGLAVAAVLIAARII